MKPTVGMKPMRSLLWISLLLVMAGEGQGWANTQAVTEKGRTWSNGPEVYEKVCALCHEAKVGPPLRGRGLAPIYIQIVVRNGLRAMPAFRISEIDDETLEEVAEFLSMPEANQ